MVKNLLFLNSGVVWGGVEGWHYKTASALASRGYNIFIRATKGTPFYKKSIEEGFNVTHISSIKGITFINPYRIAKLVKYLKRNEIDAIFFCQSSHFKFASIAAKLAGVNKIIYRRALAKPINNKFYNRFLLKNCVTDFIAISEVTKEESVKELPDDVLSTEKIKLIYNGVKIDEFINPISIINLREEIQIQEDELLIANIGRLCRQKGQNYLLQAIDKVRQRFSKFKLLLIGTGPKEAELRNMVQQLDLEDKVVFTGFRGDIPSVLNQIDFMVHTAIYEGCPWIILEAMMASTPIVATASPSLPEFVIDGENGYLAKNKDVDDIANNIIKMINENNRKKLGQKGFEIAKDRFSFKRLIDNLEHKILLN
jgi:glycosyltransferase involved in cell wall biosynthesis